MRRMAFLVLAATFVVAGFTLPANAKTIDQPALTGKPGVPATFSSVEELFTRFGLFGTWAAHCKGRATPVNPHVDIGNPSPGLVFEDHDLGGGYAVNRYSVVAAEALSPTRLAVEVVFQPGKPDEQRQWLIYEVRHDTRRTLFNRTDSGAVRVKDGIALARGTRTPVLRKCR